MCMDHQQICAAQYEVAQRNWAYLFEENWVLLYIFRRGLIDTYIF